MCGGGQRCNSNFFPHYFHMALICFIYSCRSKKTLTFFQCLHNICFVGWNIFCSRQSVDCVWTVIAIGRASWAAIGTASRSILSHKYAVCGGAVCLCQFKVSMFPSFYHVVFFYITNIFIFCFVTVLLLFDAETFFICSKDSFERRW